jgi:hypothetical protein
MPEDPNVPLMKSIGAKFGVVIADACHSSSVPESFLAGLVANETGGNPNAKRFEKGVLASLWEVLQGRAAHYGSIGRADLNQYILPAAEDLNHPADLHGFLSDHFLTAIQRLDSLATSWGLTQIMGYEAIAFDIEVPILESPDAGLRYTCRLLALMGSGRGLDLSKDFSEMFDCWNTGRPHAPTADPKYIPNGLARMQIYETLRQNSTPAPAGS